MKKGQIWISVIIYTLIAVVALVLILNTGIPILNEMRDRSMLSKIREVMLEIDNQITELAQQGEGSQATLSLDIRDGEVMFQNNRLVWEVETKSQIMSPRTTLVVGNLIIASNANVLTYETDKHFVMNSTIEDDVFSAVFNKLGSADSPGNFSTSQILNHTRYNDNMMDGNFNFLLNSNSTTAYGVLYTEMIPAGNNSVLGGAKVVAHVSNEFGNYDLTFSLGSYADFITVEIKNFKIN